MCFLVALSREFSLSLQNHHRQEASLVTEASLSPLRPRVSTDQREVRAGQATVVKRRGQDGPGHETKGDVPELGVGTVQQAMWPEQCL